MCLFIYLIFWLLLTWVTRVSDRPTATGSHRFLCLYWRCYLAIADRIWNEILCSTSSLTRTKLTYIAEHVPIMSTLLQKVNLRKSATWSFILAWQQYEDKICLRTSSSNVCFRRNMEATNMFINFFVRPRGEEIKEIDDLIQNELFLDKTYPRSTAANACVSIMIVAMNLSFFQKLDFCRVQRKYQDCSLRSFMEKKWDTLSRQGRLPAKIGPWGMNFRKWR